MRRLPAIGSRCGAHVGLSTVAAEGTSLHLNRHILNNYGEPIEKNSRYGKLYMYSTAFLLHANHPPSRKVVEAIQNKKLFFFCPIPVYQRDKKS